MNLNYESLLDTQLLKAEEVAQLLSIGRSTVYMLCRTQQLPHVVIGHSVRIPAGELKTWLRTRLSLPSEQERS